MDFLTLQAFVEVARSGSFSKAATHLFLTQPAVSKRISALEQELAISLFDRIGRQVLLTEAGQALLPRAQNLLNDAKDLKRIASNLTGQISGPLIMGTSHHVGLRRLPPVLRRFNQQNPEVRLDIRFMDSEAACQQVQRGELELAIVTLPPQPPDRLELQVIWPDPLHFVVGRDHPLAQSKLLEWEDLLPFPAVLPASGTYTREILVEALQGREFKLGMSTNYLETLKMLASTGLGWTLLPETMLSQELVTLKIKGVKLKRELGLVTHQQRTLSNAGRAMCGICMT